jgi:hypothetical protein
MPTKPNSLQQVSAETTPPASASERVRVSVEDLLRAGPTPVPALRLRLAGVEFDLTKPVEPLTEEQGRTMVAHFEQLKAELRAQRAAERQAAMAEQAKRPLPTKEEREEMLKHLNR